MMKDGTKVDFIGKSLLIKFREKGKDESALVIGDLHLGLSQAIREGGIFLPVNLYKEVKEDLEKIFGTSGKVDRVILLGDLKHEFGRILWEEWNEVQDLIDYLRDYCKEIVIVKGNHDIFTNNITKKKSILVCDYFILNGMAFLHGDRDFKEIYDRKIARWFVGHGHPAVVLREGIKKEKYKCFMLGKFKRKEIIILPSFSGINDGTDPRDFDLGIIWDFNLNKFDVKVVNEGSLEVYDFGKLENL